MKIPTGYYYNTSIHASIKIMGQHEYVTRERLVSYYNQTRLIKMLGKEVKNILEIGIYNSLFSQILRLNEYNVTTADFDSQLNPDLLIDLKTDFTIPTDKFDIIALFQVLEHIPYEYFEKVLDRLLAASKKYVILSIPYYTAFFSTRIKLNTASRPRYVFWQIPRFWTSVPLSDEHCWEMGIKGYPKKRIIESLGKTKSKIIREYQDPLHPYHYFFVLEKEEK